MTSDLCLSPGVGKEVSTVWTDSCLHHLTVQPIRGELQSGESAPEIIDKDETPAG